MRTVFFMSRTLNIFLKLIFPRLALSERDCFPVPPVNQSRSEHKMINQKNLIFNISFENETCSFYVLMLFLSVLNLDALENEKVQSKQ